MKTPQKIRISVPVGQEYTDQPRPPMVKQLWARTKMSTQARNLCGVPSVVEGARVTPGGYPGKGYMVKSPALIRARPPMP